MQRKKENENWDGNEVVAENIKWEENLSGYNYTLGEGGDSASVVEHGV